MVYPVANSGAPATISAVEKGIHFFVTSQSIVNDRGNSFINTDFINWTKELGITLRYQTAHLPWKDCKIETPSQDIAHHCRNFSNDAGTNWSSFAPKIVFAHKTKESLTKQCQFKVGKDTLRNSIRYGT